MSDYLQVWANLLKSVPAVLSNLKKDYINKYLNFMHLGASTNQLQGASHSTALPRHLVGGWRTTKKEFQLFLKIFGFVGFKAAQQYPYFGHLHRVAALFRSFENAFWWLDSFCYNVKFLPVCACNIKGALALFVLWSVSPCCTHFSGW